MKVVELIKKLNEIGYNENTELVLGYTKNIEFGSWCEMKITEVNEGVFLTEDPDLPGEKLIHVELKMA